MDNEFVKNLITPILYDLNNNVQASLYLYAFKNKPSTNTSNPHIILDYNFYDTQMGKSHISNSISNIFSYFESKWLKDKLTTYTPYNVNNPSNTIDFIKINKLDFSNQTINNGTDPSIDSNNYKINYFIKSLESNYAIAESKKDYRGLNYTVFKYFYNNHTVLIINKNKPLYKPKKLLFAFDITTDSGENIVEFNPIEKDLFRIPFYPSMIIIDDYCFMIEKNIESIFGFEEYNKKLRSEYLQKINTGLAFENNGFDVLNSFANKGKNYNIFATFEQDRLDKINAKDADVIQKLNQLSITFSNSGNLIIADENDAQNLLNFLCCNIKSDLYSNKLCISPKSIEIP